MREREKITARGRKIKREGRIGSVIMVTGRAGLARASPFF